MDTQLMNCYVLLNSLRSEVWLWKWDQTPSPILNPSIFISKYPPRFLIQGWLAPLTLLQKGERTAHSLKFKHMSTGWVRKTTEAATVYTVRRKCLQGNRKFIWGGKLNAELQLTASPPWSSECCQRLRWWCHIWWLSSPSYSCHVW